MYANRKITLPLVLSLVFVLWIGGTALFAQEMTMEEYNQRLDEWQKREVDAKAEIKKVDTAIDSLKNEMTKVDDEVTSVWQEIYAMLGTDEAGVNEFRNNLESLENEVDGLSALTADELYQHRKEIDELEARLSDFKKSKISALTEMQDKIATIEGKIASLRTILESATPYEEYTVIKGDYLWKISKKEEIYSDPYQWIRIYTYNRDQIKDPDLIYPEQIFKVQRRLRDNEYLVVKGDFLRKIAEKPEILGDPKRWTELFEANKTIVGEDKMLYPYQVLIIPGK